MLMKSKHGMNILLTITFVSHDVKFQIENSLQNLKRQFKMLININIYMTLMHHSLQGYVRTHFKMTVCVT